MDMEVRGGGRLVAPFLQRYRESINDTEANDLLPFWQCYRALVRAKVYALRGESEFDSARRYARYAARIAWQSLQPFIVIVSGLTGSGKSTLARELSERIGVPAINSDIVRKKLAGKQGRQAAPYNQGIYSAAMTEKTYARMSREAEKLILSGRGVILDGTFVNRSQRQKILALAHRYQFPLLAVHCVVSDDITRERLAHRESAATDVSDGRWEIYEQQKTAFQPLDDIPVADRVELDTDATLDALAITCEKFIRTRLARH